MKPSPGVNNSNLEKEDGATLDETKRRGRPRKVPSIPEQKSENVPADYPREDVPPNNRTASRYSSDALIEEDAQDRQANRKLRSDFAEKAYKLACGSIGFWIILLSVNGIFHVATGRQGVSDYVLIAVTTGVTINVLAAFLGVIRGLFPANEKISKKKRGKRKEKTG